MTKKSRTRTKATTRTPLPPPRPSDLFGRLGDRNWTEEHWRTVLAAAQLLPDAKDHELLKCCGTQKNCKRFMTIYKDAHGELLRTVPLPQPPPEPTRPSDLFKSLGGGDWSDDQWRTALAAAQAFSNATTRKVLECYVEGNDREGFELKYTAAYKKLPPPLLATAYVEHCIDQKMEKRSITLQWFDDDEGSESKTSRFAASSTAAGRYRERVVLSDCRMKPISAIALNATVEMMSPTAISHELLNILSGESGNGKTTFSFMTSALGIYLTPTDLATTMTRFALPSPDSTTKDVLDKARAARNQLVIDTLHDAVKSILDDVFNDHGDKYRNKDTVCMSLVMDEFGSYPDFVRGLCAAHKAVQAKIKELLPFEVTLKMIVVGTGTDVQSNMIGSQPETYFAMRMPDETSMLDTIMKALERRYSKERVAVLVSALQSHAQVEHLVKNPRFAACLLNRLVGYFGVTHESRYDELFPTKEAALMCLDMHLIVAARDFKVLNGMSDQKRQDVERTYALAIQLLLRSPDDQRPLTKGELSLIASKGVLTDRAIWQTRGKVLQNYVKVGEDSIEATNGTMEQHYDLMVPETGRYAMSMAQQLLFRMGYGYQVLESAASWERYEVAVAEYMGVLLLAMRGQKLRDLLLRLGAPDTSGVASTNVAAAVVTKRMTFTSVATIHSTTRIDPNTRCETLTALYQSLANSSRENTAVVIVNGAGAPYADVIVVVPGVAVILIQCKFYSERSTFSVADEAKKLEAEIKELNGIAKVPSDAYFRILATTKHFDPADLHGFYLLNTSSATSLAPLFTPIHPGSSPKKFKLVRSVNLLPTESKADDARNAFGDKKLELAQRVGALLYAMKEQTLRDVLHRLNVFVPQGAVSSYVALDRKMSFTRVATIDCTKRINADTTRETLDKLYKDCRSLANSSPENTAIVIVNGPGAWYADIIAVVPFVAVILIQCEFCRDRSRDRDSSRDRIADEAKKLEAEIKELDTIAKVPTGAYFRILATTKQFNPLINLHGFYLLDPATSLAARPIPADAAKDFKVVRAVGLRKAAKLQRDEV